MAPSSAALPARQCSTTPRTAAASTLLPMTPVVPVASPPPMLLCSEDTPASNEDPVPCSRPKEAQVPDASIIERAAAVPLPESPTASTRRTLSPPPRISEEELISAARADKASLLLRVKGMKAELKAAQKDQKQAQADAAHADTVLAAKRQKVAALEEKYGQVNAAAEESTAAAELRRAEGAAKLKAARDEGQRKMEELESVERDRSTALGTMRKELDELQKRLAATEEDEAQLAEATAKEHLLVETQAQVVLRSRRTDQPPVKRRRRNGTDAAMAEAVAAAQEQRDAELAVWRGELESRMAEVRLTEAANADLQRQVDCSAKVAEQVAEARLAREIWEARHAERMEATRGRLAAAAAASVKAEESASTRRQELEQVTAEAVAVEAAATTEREDEQRCAAQAIERARAECAAAVAAVERERDAVQAAAATLKEQLASGAAQHCSLVKEYNEMKREVLSRRRDLERRCAAARKELRALSQQLDPKLARLFEARLPAAATAADPKPGPRGRPALQKRTPSRSVSSHKPVTEPPTPQPKQGKKRTRSTEVVTTDSSSEKSKGKGKRQAPVPPPKKAGLQKRAVQKPKPAPKMRKPKKLVAPPEDDDTVTEASETRGRSTSVGKGGKAAKRPSSKALGAPAKVRRLTVVDDDATTVASLPAKRNRSRAARVVEDDNSTVVSTMKTQKKRRVK